MSPNMTKTQPKGESLRDRLNQFRRKTIQHTFYERAVEDMFVQLLDFDDPPIILLVGPAGSGKSRSLRFDLPHRLLPPADNTSVQRPCPYRPYVYTELPSVDHMGFRWLDYYQRGLIALNEPMVAAVRRASPQELVRVMRPLSEGTRARGTGLARLQLETAMIERRVRWWVMDNAAALVYVASSSSYFSQLNTVMSLANMTGAAIVVSSTYEVLSLIDLNGQLDRRIIDIELPRYNAKKNESDYTAFCNAVLDHLEFSPIPLKGDPVSYLPMFFQGSLGLFGCWKVWFDRTLSEAIQHGSRTIGKDLLVKWSYSKGKLDAMLSEIVDGEALYASFKEHRQHLDQPPREIAEKGSAKRKSRAPGKRNAHHDTVGEAA